MKKIAALILTLVLVLAGTAALADSIHDTLSSLMLYIGSSTLDESLIYSMAGTDPVDGVYYMCNSDNVFVEYSDGSTVRQYYYSVDGDNSATTCVAAAAYLLEEADVLPYTYARVFINADSGAYSLYSPILGDSDLQGSMYNEFDDFMTYIMNS